MLVVGYKSHAYTSHYFYSCLWFNDSALVNLIPCISLLGKTTATLTLQPWDTILWSAADEGNKTSVLTGEAEVSCCELSGFALFVFCPFFRGRRSTQHSANTSILWIKLIKMYHFIFEMTLLVVFWLLPFQSCLSYCSCFGQIKQDYLLHFCFPCFYLL